MHIHHCYKLRNLILAAVLTIGFASSALAQGFSSFIVDLNSKEATGLGTLGGNAGYASGINDAGRVVGWSVTTESGPHAFITGPNGVGMTDLGTPGGGEESWAYGINDAGRVVGESHVANVQSRAFITGPNGVGMSDLGTLGGGYSVAYGINDMGQVVGESTARTSPYQGHAFITGPNGVGMTALAHSVALAALSGSTTWGRWQG
jgi:probable HAF family extracellular repeat protein